MFKRWRPFNRSKQILRHNKEFSLEYPLKFSLKNNMSSLKLLAKSYAKPMQICNMVGVEVFVIVVETKVRFSLNFQFQNHRCWQKRFIWISAALYLNILFTQEGCRSLFPALAGQFKSTGGLYRWINEKVIVNLLVIIFFNLWNRWN